VFQVGANAGETIQATTANFRTAQYGNYRVGASTAAADGDLVTGSTTNAIVSNAKLTPSRVLGSTATINGFAGSAAITVAAGDSAKTVAAAINAQTATTGVKASAKTEFDLSAFTASSSYSFNVTSDNSTAVTIAFTTGTSTSGDGLSAAITAFNDVSSKTGVTAKLNAAGTGVTLLNATGNNITVLNNAGSTSITVGGTATAAAATAVGTGQLTVDSEKSFNVVSTGAGATTDFFNAATSASQLQSVSNLDVTSVGGAQRSLAIVDSALASVSGQRAKFGALQSRFETTISNLQIASDNLSAARSRIRDADFAAETANLTRGQILQQAGAAILAQANALPQNVLTLLR
jgi:flagellin